MGEASEEAKTEDTDPTEAEPPILADEAPIDKVEADANSGDQPAPAASVLPRPAPADPPTVMVSPQKHRQARLQPDDATDP